MSRVYSDHLWIANSMAAWILTPITNDDVTIHQQYIVIRVPARFPWTNIWTVYLRWIDRPPSSETESPLGGEYSWLDIRDTISSSLYTAPVATYLVSRAVCDVHVYEINDQVEPKVSRWTRANDNVLYLFSFNKKPRTLRMQLNWISFFLHGNASWFELASYDTMEYPHQKHSSCLSVSVSCDETLHCNIINTGQRQRCSRWRLACDVTRSLSIRQRHRLRYHCLEFQH